MPEKLLDYPLTEAKAEIVDGVRETPVQENTSPKGNVVNTVTVSEVKKIVREAIDHFEQEEGGVTEEELNAALATKADKVGVLPYYTVNLSDNVKTFLTTNGVVNGKPIILTINGPGSYYAELMFSSHGSSIIFGLFDMTFSIPDIPTYVYKGFISSNVDSITFQDLIDHQYRHTITFDENTPIIKTRDEGQVLTNTQFASFKPGDILKVGSSLFLINTVETTGEGAYYGITGNRIASITSTSITVEYIDWRTVGEGYTELEVKTTTLSIANNE